MELTFPLVADALAECDLAVDEGAACEGRSFSRMEIHTELAIAQDVLYVTDDAGSQGVGEGAFIVAGPNAPAGALAHLAGATASEAMNAMSRFIARLSACTSRIEESCDKGDAQGLCQALADFTGNPVVIYDDTMMPVAQTDFPRDYALRVFGAEAIDGDYVFRAVPDGEMLVVERAAKAASRLLPLRNTSFIESSLAGKPLQGPRASVWLSALRWHADDELYVAAIDLSEAYDKNRYARRVVERTLRSLLPNSDYTLTVKAYIETGFNLAATAKRLNVHRNTAAYRLQHMAERYEVDLSSPIADSELVFQVLLSCKLLLELDA